MASMPLVSAVIIFLDEERFLPEAVESVLAQTYPSWELVLVDDGSTDRSAEIARNFAARDGRIRYVTHPGGANQGMSASRNRGVAASSGELVAFLDADDVWLAEKLADQVELMQRHPEASMVYGRTEWWYSWSNRPEDANRDYLYDPDVPLDAIAEPPSLLPSLISNDGNPPYTCSMLIRRSAYERLGGFEESFRGLFEDQAFFAKVFLEEIVYVSSRCWDRYRQHELSACASGLRTGDLHPLDLSPSRGVFLEWLDRYLDSRDVHEPELRTALDAELLPYRHPTAPAVVYSVEHLGSRAPGLLGAALDLPRTGDRTGGRLVHFMGWALGSASSVREMELRAEGRVIASVPLDHRRPDLALAFPDVEAAGRAGFCSAVGLTGMSPLTVDVVAVFEDGNDAPIARIAASRSLRGIDAGIGYPLVSVIVAGGDASATADALDDLVAQTYPKLDVVVVSESPDVVDVAQRVLGARLVRESADAFRVSGLRAARGELVVFLAGGERLGADALEAGIAALAASPESPSTTLPGTEGSQVQVTMHRRFNLLPDGAPRPAAQPPPVARTAARVRRGRTLILMYHRVAGLDSDPWSLAVRPDRFREHVDVLQKYEVTPLSRALEPSRNGGRVVITFDDGYSDNLEAARILSARGLPATYFLTAGGLQAGREYWWDELERVLLSSPDLPETLELELAGRSLRFDFGAQHGIDPSWRATGEPRTERQRAFVEIYHSLQPMDTAAREAFLAHLFDWAGVPREARPSVRPLTDEEVVDLAGLDGADVGAHTITHPVLAALPVERQREEIRGSRARLGQLVGRNIESFAYPHGRRVDYTSQTVALVTEAGFRRACIAEGRAVGPSATVFELPRLMVEDWHADEFERRVHDALAEPTS